MTRRSTRIYRRLVASLFPLVVLACVLLVSGCQRTKTAAADKPEPSDESAAGDKRSTTRQEDVSAPNDAQPTGPQPTDGEATDGEATDGEATDGEATVGEATDGEATDGEATDGEATDGEATVGEADKPDSPAPTVNSTDKRPFGLILEKEFPDHTFSVTPLILGKRMILADYEGRVKSVRLESGLEEWEFQGDSLGYDARIVADGDWLYAAAFEGFVDCLNVKSGDSLWNFNCDATISAPPLVHNDILLVGTQSAQLICLDKLTGKERWRFQATDQIHSVPQIVEDKILVVAACSRIMHVVDLASGDEVRKIELPGESASPFVVVGDLVYITTMYGEALCYDWHQAKKVWGHAFNPEIEPQMEGGPLIVDDIMYVAGTDSFVRAFNIKTKKAVWAQRIKGTIESSLAISKSVVFAVTPRGRIYGLDRQTGVIRWKYETNGDFLDAPVVVDDTIIFVNNEGMLYRFGPISMLP